MIRYGSRRAPGDRRLARSTRLIATAGLVALLAGCTSVSAPAAPGGGSGGSSPAEPVGGGSSAGAGAATPCDLLTTDEIAAVVATPMKPGVLDQGSDSATCTFDAVDGSKAIEVTVGLHAFSQDDWDRYQRMGTAENANRPIPGVGDEAIELGGVILSETIVIRKGAAEADLALTAPYLDAASREKARLDLARLMAGRM